ncbi:MAG: Chitinase [Chthonomonadaceae bacterium]|nr:Chitinase [Chthonomonadaceae bacterium]
MKRLLELLICIVIVGTMGSVYFEKRNDAARNARRTEGKPPSDLWVTAYYAGWKANVLKPADIDFSDITHLIHFALVPTKTGTLDAARNLLSEEQTAEVATAAHKIRKKVLVAVGGQGTHDGFAAAIRDDHRAEFIRNIVAWVDRHKYDGVDLDMEPIVPADVPFFQRFVPELRQALHAHNPAWLLTAAAEAKDEVPAIFKPLAADLDQINLMTYDMSGAYQGWETWYNSPLYNGGRKFKSNGEPLPSCAQVVEHWESAGFPPAKLGIGIALYGVIWHGATGPNQSITGVTTEDSIPYAEIMQKYYTPAQYHWDKGAETPYLSRSGATKADNIFISYEDAMSSKAKIEYVRSQRLGGIMLFELGDSYRADQPVGRRSLLLKSIHTEATGHTAGR